MKSLKLIVLSLALIVGFAVVTPLVADDAANIIWRVKYATP